MTQLTNVTRTGGFIQSEAEWARSRDRVTIAGGTGGAGKLNAGSVLGKITSSGKYILSAATGSDGSQTAVAVLVDSVDATSADVVNAAVIARNAEVRLEDLTFDASVTAGAATTTKIGQLATATIIVRQSNGVQTTTP